MKRAWTMASVVAGAGLAAAMMMGGPTNPPPGPVSSQYKTLTEVEPRIAINATNTPGDADSLFKITQPGSYYLTGNITGVAGKHGIEIVASGVTLDLNGFDLVGIPAMGAFDGVSVTAAGLRNIAVVNGSVRNWGDEGVDLGTFATANCRVADLLASGNTDNGIFTSNGCTVSNCSATSNASVGIITGIGSTISNCLAGSNTASGISTFSGCTVSNCAAASNTAGGINTGTGGTVTNCSAYLNTGTGISTSVGSTVSNCSAYQNTGNGISVNTGGTVADCTARANSLDGIVCSTGCVIRGNTSTSNGSGGDGAGIHATGSDNRIEGNNCTTADRGIDVDIAGNFISRNICAGNTTNWDVLAGNVCLVVQGVTGAAILGNTGGVAPGSTDPNANFTY